MKLLVNRIAFIEAMAVAEKIILQRTPHPALRCVKLTAKDRRLVMECTSLDLSVYWPITQVDIASEGECLVPADKLMQLTQSTPDDTLTFDLATEALIVKSADSRSEVGIYPVADFPQIVRDEAESKATAVACGNLHEAMGRVVYAMAKEISRYAMTGVNFELAKSTLELTATDGHMLAHRYIDLSARGDDFKFILPSKAANVVLGFIRSDPEQVCKISMAGNRAMFEVDGRKILAGTNEGMFPPWRDVIPKDTVVKMSANRERLIAAIKRARIFAADPTSVSEFPVTLKASGSTMTVKNYARDDGESTIDVPVECEGEAFEAHYPTRRILAILESFDRETVVMKLTKRNAAVIDQIPGHVAVLTAWAAKGGG